MKDSGFLPQGNGDNTLRFHAFLHTPYDRNAPSMDKFDYDSQNETEKILERITDGFIAFDNRSHVIYINKAAETMLELSRHDVLYKQIEDLRVSEHFVKHYLKAVNQQVTVSFEGNYTPANLWCDVTMYPSATGVSVFFKNISERKEREEQIRRLSLVATNTNNAVMILSVEGTVMWANAAFYHSTGFSAEEVTGKSPADILHGPDTNQQVAEYMHQQFLKGAGFQTEIICYKKNGQQYWASVNCQPIYEDGELRKFFTITSDVTDRKRAEEELKKLSLIVRDASNPILLLNEEKRITWANDAFLKFSGYTCEEALGRTPGELLRGAETDHTTVSRLHSSWDAKKIFHSDLLCYHKKRHKLRAEVTSQALFDANGHFQQYFIILKDITEQTRLQEELALQQKEKQRQITIAATKAQELERLRVGKELHDNVNQVLTTVKLYTELCRDGAENHQYLMTRSVSLLQDCINDIRSLSKRLTGPAPSEISLTESIKDLVQTILETQKVRIKLYTINLENFNAGEELHLAIYRILQEHLTNILKHASAELVVIRVQRSAKFITLKVVDNGKGFNTEIPRSGIGLTNMKTRAINLKGCLQITSSPGKGCELLVRLPLT